MEIEDWADVTSSIIQGYDVSYYDIRAENITKNFAQLEDGGVVYTKLTEESGIGIRVLKDGAWGFYSTTNYDRDSLKAAVEGAVKSAKYSALKKKKRTKIKSQKSNHGKFDFKVLVEPEIGELIKLAKEHDSEINSEKNIIKSSIRTGYNKTRKYFVNSEGSKISQNYTDVISEITAVARDSGITQSINTTEGGRGGLEQISRKDVGTIAKNIANQASMLTRAKAAKENNDATVILDPDFVSLLTHEILGHPSEADRVLGKEMAWAGGSWWKGRIGKKIASENLSVFDDPTIKESLGWYYYDDEGIMSEKTQIIKDGILVNHLQNRETAVEYDVEPTANMRATSFRFIPLVRMACTCIEPGDWSTEEMIKETKNGYMISGMKIPSIDMKRYNWSISCQYAQKIENGAVTELLRDVIVMGVAPIFFNSIDACGKDFTVRPITNCGKGDPMQQMIMGNGGPTIRAVASIKNTSEK